MDLFHLIYTDLVQTASLQCNANKKSEHTAVTLGVSIINIYLNHPRLITVPEKPPSFDRTDRRRIDLITYAVPAQWTMVLKGFWEFKKEESTPRDIEICEQQLLDGCTRHFMDKAGSCYAWSCIGRFYRVFLFRKPEATSEVVYWTSLTGMPQGEASLDHYVDITADNEAPLIDKIFREFRVFLGYVAPKCVYETETHCESSLRRDDIRHDCVNLLIESQKDRQLLNNHFIASRKE